MHRYLLSWRWLAIVDHGQLRANLKEMPPTAAAYRRYLKKFHDQETEIEQLRAELKKLQGTEHQQKGAVDAYLARLTVEEGGTAAWATFEGKSTR